MHAVIVDVTINDPEAAEQNLRSEVVPRVSSAPGFVAGYWSRPEPGKGVGFIVFESEDAAQQVAQMLEERGPGSDAVSLDSVRPAEVVANA